MHCLIVINVRTDRLSQGKTKPYKKENDEHSDEEGEENQKLETMQEMFPQRDRNQLLEVVNVCTFHVHRIYIPQELHVSLQPCNHHLLLPSHS